MNKRIQKSLFKCVKILLLVISFFVSLGCAPQKSRVDPILLENQLKSIVPLKTAPPFSLRDVDGKMVSLSDYRGKIVLLNFWATWCGSCRDEFHSLAKLHDSLAGLPFTVVTVGVDSDSATLISYLRGKSFSFPSLIDNDNKARRQYDISGLPVTLIINKEGKLLSFPDPETGRLETKLIGPRKWDQSSVVEIFRALSSG